MPLMPTMLIVLGVLLVIFTLLLIYRSTLVMHEDDQLFLNDSESHMAKEQTELQGRMRKLDPMVRAVGALCGLMILAIAGMWIWAGVNSTSLPH